MVLVLASAAIPLRPAHAQTLQAPEIMVPAGHSDSINKVVFSRDNRWVATASNDKTIKIWDLASGRLLRTLVGHEDQVTSIALMPDGKSIMSVSRSARFEDADPIRIWSVENGQLLKQWTVRGSAKATHISVTPNGDLLAVSSDTITRRDTESGKLAFRNQLDTFQGIRSFAVSSDHSLLAVGHLDFNIFKSAPKGADVTLWNAETGKLEKRLLPGHKESINSIAFSPDGRRLASASNDKTVRIWNVQTGELLRILEGHTEGVQAVSFSPDSRRVISASSTGNDDKVRVWDAATGRLVKTLDERGVHTIQFSPDGRTLALAGSSIRLLDAETLSLQHAMRGNEGRRSTSIRIHPAPQGKWLAYMGARGAVLDPGTGRIDQFVQANSGRAIRSAVGDRTERRLVPLISGTTVRLLDVVSGVEVSSIETGKSTVGRLNQVAVSPDGQWLATGGAGKEGFYTAARSIQLWNVANRKLVRTLNENDRDLIIQALAFSPDSRHLALGATRWKSESKAHTIKIFEVANGRLIKSMGQHTIWYMKFLLDGRTIFASTGGDQNVAAFDVATGRQIWTWGTGKGLVFDALPSPDNQWVAFTINPDVVILDSKTGAVIRQLEKNPGDSHSLAVSNDSSKIIAGNGNGTSAIWNRESGALLATTFYPQGDSTEWVTITPEGFFTASERGGELLHIVQGMQVTGIEQVYQALYRPDLVREKLAGDPRGLVREAAAKLDLARVLASGAPPRVTVASPRPGTAVTTEQASVTTEISEAGGGIGRIEWRVNGVNVGVDERNTPASTASGAPLRLTRELPLDDGDNDIEVIAYNNANLVASLPSRVRIESRPQAGRAAARLFVLAVGLNDYAEPGLKLTYAVPDAKVLTQALAQTGKEMYQSTEVTLVQDADVTREKLDAAFSDLANKVRPSDTFVFFIGGHGKTVDGRYYFIPQQFNMDSVRAAQTPGTTPEQRRRLLATLLQKEVVAQGIPQEQWQTWFARVPARKSVLLFDTCESGTLTEEARVTQALERGAASDRLVQATGRTILTAASGDADANEGYRGHGLFTYHVLDALQRADGDGNGTIELVELATHVYSNVVAVSEQVFKQRQVPQVRLTSNYALAKPVRVLPESAPGIAIPAKPTHRINAAANLVVLPAVGARRVRRLEPQTPVTLVTSEAGWTLVAREGKSLGYVAAHELTPIQ